MLNVDLFPQIEEIIPGITPYLQQTILKKECDIEVIMQMIDKKIQRTIANMLGISPDDVYISNNGKITKIFISHGKVDITQWDFKDVYYLPSEDIYIIKNKVCAYTNRYEVQKIIQQIQNSLNSIIEFFEKFHHEVYLYVKTYVYQTKEA